MASRSIETFKKFFEVLQAQQSLTCSNSTTETLEKGVKYVEFLFIFCFCCWLWTSNFLLANEVKNIWRQCYFVGNKAKGRISKRVFQENKALQIFRKTKISYPLIRTRFALLPYYRRLLDISWEYGNEWVKCSIPITVFSLV